MAYDDKKIEISMGSIINKLSNVDFYEDSSQHSNSNPAQTATPNYSPHSNQVQNSPPPTYVPSSMVTPQSVQKEIQKRIQHDILMDAFFEIYNTPRGLCGKNKYNAERVVFELELESCVYIKPDPCYDLVPFYRIIFKGWQPLDLAEKDFAKPGKLVQAISSHCGAQFHFYSNKGKVQNGTQALLNRVARSSPQYEIPFYYGWTPNKTGWMYSLSNDKTHGSKKLQFQNSASDSASFPQESSLPSAPVELTAIRQVTTMMEVFTDSTVRKIVWNILHIASLYSLLNGLGYRFPLGICIFSDDALVKKTFRNILSWFDDQMIVLSENTQFFINSCVERKDQPLLIQDIDAQIINSKIIETAVQTGNLSRKHESYELKALPVILSSNDTHLSLSSSFMRLEIPINDLDPAALEMINKAKPFFKYYFLHFNLFVQNNIFQLQSSLNIHNTGVFEASIADKLSLECTTALAIMRAVDDLISLYCDSLQFSIGENPKPNCIGENDYNSSLIAALVQTSHRENSTSVAQIFFSTATQKILDGFFEIRNHGKANTYDPCPPDKQGVVYIYEGDLCFSKEAFDATQKETGYGYYTILRALKDVRAFSGAPINTNTPQYKMPGYNSLTDQPNTHVYRFSKEFIKIPEKQTAEVASPVLKAPGECDFSLHVGTSINGNPIIWNNRNNGHICVTGNTGVGKTFFLKKLIAQLPEHNARCVIFDVESDFSKTGEGSPDDWNTLSFDILEWEKEQIDPIPFYPIIPDESNEKIANRITNTLSSILAMGEVQSPWIKSEILLGLYNGSITCLHDLILKLFQPMRKTLPSLKLEGLISIAPEDCVPFDWKLDSPGITILKINNGDDPDTLKKLIEMILSTLYYMKKYSQDVSKVPLVFVIDECMMLNWNKESTAHQIMIRGRKDGMCAWLSSQYIPTSKEAMVWEEADMRIYFQQTSDNAKKIARQLAGSDKKLQKYYCDQLESLERGQFIFKQNRNIQISQIPNGSK